MSFLVPAAGAPGRSRARLESLVNRLSAPCMDSLRELVRNTRIRQSEYLREAVADLLALYQRQGFSPPRAPSGGFWTRGEVATHFLVPEEHWLAMRDISTETRITQAHLLQEGVAALLFKYAHQWLPLASPGSPHPVSCFVDSCRGNLFEGRPHPATGRLWLCCLACAAPQPMPPTAVEPT